MKSLLNIFLPVLIGALAALTEVSADSVDYTNQNVVVEFHGRVVDPDGTPITQARIKYFINYYPQGTFSKHGFRKRNRITSSDNHGNFSIYGKGISVQIDKVSKSGWNFGSHLVVVSDFHQARGAEAALRMNSDNPVLFIGHAE